MYPFKNLFMKIKASIMEILEELSSVAFGIIVFVVPIFLLIIWGGRTDLNFLQANVSSYKVCSYNAYNCDDFGGSWSKAQNTYEYCLDHGFGDVHDLDRDSDGIACEALR